MLTATSATKEECNVITVRGKQNKIKQMNKKKKTFHLIGELRKRFSEEVTVEPGFEG